MFRHVVTYLLKIIIVTFLVANIVIIFMLIDIGIRIRSCSMFNYRMEHNNMSVPCLMQYPRNRT